MGIGENDSYFKYFICAGLAGALASIPTCPFDVVKTRLNTQTSLKNNSEKITVRDIERKLKTEQSILKSQKLLIEPRIKMSISS